MSGAFDSAQFAVKSERSAHRHALPPILLGLLAPMLLFLLIDTRALEDASLIAHVYMIAIFVVAGLAYLFSVFETGEVTSATADNVSRTIVVERTGLLARSEIEIPFNAIATVRMDTRYDDDGYQTAVPVLVLATREMVQLPAGTSESDIAGLRAIIWPG